METKKLESSAGIGGAGFATALGGVVAVVGSLFTWISVELAGRGPGGGISVRGLSLIPGKVALGAGVALILAGGALFIVPSWPARRWLTVLAVVAGALVVGAAIAAFQSEVQALLRELLGGAPGKARGAGGGGLFRRFESLAAAGPSRGAGVYLSLAGGLVALAGGVAGVFWTTTPVSAPPGASTGGPDSEATESFSKGRVG